MNAMRKTTRVLIVLSIIATCALLLSACAAPENANNAAPAATNTNTTTTTTTTTTAPTNTATTTTAPTNTATTNTAATAPAGDKIGVEECDDYLAKYESCLTGKVPAAARAQWEASLKTTREAWHKAAATPQGKAGFAQACKAANDAAKQSMASFGCTF